MVFSKLALCSLLLLTACQFKASAPPVTVQARSLQPATTALFPVQPGYSWDYALTVAPVNDPDAEEQGRYTVQIEGVQALQGGTALDLRVIDTFFNRYSFPRLIQSAQGVTLQDATYLGFGADEVAGLRLDFLRVPLQAGQRWEEENWLATVKGQENITVPAGSFLAWRIEVIGTYQQAYTAVGDYWLVPGQGIVKSRLTIPGWHVDAQLLSSGLRKGARP